MPPKKRQAPKTRSRGPVTPKASAAKRAPKTQTQQIQQQDGSNRAQNMPETPIRPNRTIRQPVRFRSPDLDPQSFTFNAPTPPEPIFPRNESHSTRQEAQNVIEAVGVVRGAEEARREVEQVVFPVEVSVRVLQGKTCVRRVNLEEPYTNETLNDLSELESRVIQEVDLVCKERRLSALDIIRRTAFIRTNNRTLKDQDFAGFGLQDALRLVRLIEGVQKNHPYRTISVVWEIETVAPVTKRPRTQSHDDSSSMPPTPPTTSSKRRRRTDDLEDEARARKKSKKELREEKIQYAADWESQLTDRLTCHSKDCDNEENFCWIDTSSSPHSHYNVTFQQQAAWANEITAGKATLANPPAKLILYWTTEQGPITKGSRASTRKTFQKATTESLANLAVQGDQVALQTQQLAAAQLEDRLAALQEKQENRVLAAESRVREQEKERRLEAREEAARIRKEAQDEEARIQKAEREEEDRREKKAEREARKTEREEEKEERKRKEADEEQRRRKKEERREEEEEERKRKKQETEEAAAAKQRKKEQRKQEEEEEAYRKRKEQQEREREPRRAHPAPNPEAIPVEGGPLQQLVAAVQQLQRMQSLMMQQQQQDHIALPPLPPNPPLNAPPPSLPPPRRSSPISTILPDREILKLFFKEEARGLDAEGQDKVARVCRIVNDQDWSISDLKEMEDRKSETYHLAREAGISDGFAKNFSKRLRAFKAQHRRDEEAAKSLAYM